MKCEQPAGGDYILVGLTGGIGAGKSEVAALLEQKGAAVISADRIGKDALENHPELLQRVRDTFGNKFFDDSGKLLRRKLGDLIFSDSRKKKMLDDIVFPQLYMDMKQQVEALSGKYNVIVVDAALIFEWGIEDDFDIILTVIASPEKVMERLVSRDNFSPEQVQMRLQSQLPPEQKAARSDWVIYNDDDKDQLAAKVEEFWREKITAP